MKKLILFILLAVICVNTLAQKRKAVLYFKDGKTIEGLAYITKYGEKVKFRKDKKSKRITYDYRQISHFNLWKVSKKDTVIHKYYYKKVENSNSYSLLELLVSGKVNLYSKTTNHGSNSFRGFSVHNFYLSRNHNENVTSLGSTSPFTKNFKKAAANYFKDCKILVEKINNREFRKPNITEMVDFYNNNCK